MTWLTSKRLNDNVEIKFDFSNFKQVSKEDSIDMTIDELTARNTNIYLALSGGIDSEFAAKCLKQRGVKFTPIIFDFTLNKAEAWNAYYWCYENHIKPEVVNMSVAEMKLKFPDIARTYKTSFINSIDFILEEYVRSRDGELVICNNTPFIRDKCFADILQNKTSTHLQLATYDFGLDLAEKNDICCDFLSLTPELFFNLIVGLDYNKPIQVALSDYYGVRIRPKVPYAMNVGLDAELFSLSLEINKSIQLKSIDIGEKDAFLKKALNQEIITVTSR